jgi:hypothetical protein
MSASAAQSFYLTAQSTLLLLWRNPDADQTREGRLIVYCCEGRFEQTDKILFWNAGGLLRLFQSRIKLASREAGKLRFEYHATLLFRDPGQPPTKAHPPLCADEAIPFGPSATFIV